MREGRAGQGWAAGMCLLGWLVAVLGTLLGGPVRAQDAAALLTAARPAMEEALGCRLEPPQVRVATTAELPAFAGPEVAAGVGWQFPDLQGERRAQAVEAARGALRNVTLAAWPAGQDSLLLFADNARQMAGWDPSLRRLASPEALQLALVHEAARASLERRYDLSRRLAACRDGEEFAALQAVAEGRALELTRQVARRLGTEVYFPVLAERCLHLPDSESDRLLRLVSQETLRQRYRTGQQGLAFFDALDGRGVRDAEARVLARPPRLRAWVERPELYLQAQQENRTDLGDVLARLEQALPTAEWSAAQEPWTPAMLRQTAALFGAGDRMERLLGQWAEGRSLVWTARKQPDHQLAVGVIRFREAAGAQAYFGLAAELQRKQDEMMGKVSGGACRVLESRSRAVSVAGADEAACTEKRMQFAGAAEPLAVTQYWVRRGDTVLQLSWTGLAARPEWVDWAVQVLAAGGR
jgi:hypothetical protein